MKILSLTRYSRRGASSRLRSLQYFPALAAAGVSVEHRPLFDDAYLQALYTRQPTGARQRRAVLDRIKSLCGVRRGQFDLIWLEKELLPWLPYGLEALLLPRHTPLLLDYDDAIFHNYDLHPRAGVRALLGDKIDRLMRRADLVVGGSPYLCDRARRAGAARVEYLPTVVDLQRYPVVPPRPVAGRPLRIGWMGTPVTARFLDLVQPALQALSQQYELELLVVGAPLVLDGVKVVHLPWSEDGEAAAIQTMDIGIMPLTDSPWERGKCGYKLIQYMASGRPVVASPVGVNRELVSDGINGFCAETPEQWVLYLDRLLRDVSLREHCGAAARRRVEDLYCLQRTAPQLVGWMKELLA